ncbi:IS481 family transposase, partial [Mycobacterium frederiksbergense]|nr:IS481 family transposase [Mycolicibacterium frederiksbergense]
PRPDAPVLPAVTTPRRSAPTDLPAGTKVATLTSAGAFVLAGVRYQVDGGRGFEQVLVVIDGEKITVADLDGEVLIEHTRPAPGVKYVGNGRPRGPRPKNEKPSPMS